MAAVVPEAGAKPVHSRVNGRRDNRPGEERDVPSVAVRFVGFPPLDRLRVCWTLQGTTVLFGDGDVDGDRQVGQR